MRQRAPTGSRHDPLLLADRTPEQDHQVVVGRSLPTPVGYCIAG